MGLSYFMGRSSYLLALLALFMVFNSLFTQAEIFKCRDGNGRASFSQQPCSAATVVGNSEAHKLWREMRFFIFFNFRYNEIRLPAYKPGANPMGKIAQL